MVRIILNFFFFIFKKDEDDSIELSISRKIRALIVLLFLYYFSVLFFSLIRVLLVECDMLSPLIRKHEFTGLQLFLLPIIVAPIAEELIFRLWLKYKSINISLSIMVFAFYVTNVFFKHSLYTDPSFKHILFAILISLLIFFITYYITRKYDTQLSLLFGKYDRVLFFISAIAFGYIHLLNFEITSSIIYLSPIVVSSFITFGLIAGYIRIRFGFIYNVAFHMIANSIPILINILLK